MSDVLRGLALRFCFLHSLNSGRTMYTQTYDDLLHQWRCINGNRREPEHEEVIAGYVQIKGRNEFVLAVDYFSELKHRIERIEEKLGISFSEY